MAKKSRKESWYILLPPYRQNSKNSHTSFYEPFSRVSGVDSQAEYKMWLVFPVDLLLLRELGLVFP